MNATMIAAVVGLAALASACDGGGPARSADPTLGGSPGAGSGAGAASSSPGAQPGGSAGGAIASSPNPELQWKRHVAFENDLSTALALPKDELCKEMGTANCIREVHLSPLGGHDPFTTGLLEPSAEPLATTPSVTERIVLAACARRAQLDAAAGAQPILFKGMNLNAPAPAPAAPEVQAVVADLYHRFHARDPDPAERDLVAGLARGADGSPVSALAFAQSACFAVGSTTEFLFF